MSSLLPENQLIKINLYCRMTMAFVFVFHGLVPKILFPSETELMLIILHNLPIGTMQFAIIAGVLEILLGLSLVLMRRLLVPVYLAAAALLALLIDVAIVKPTLLVEAFNPVSLNLACMMLCYVIVLTHSTDEKQV